MHDGFNNSYHVNRMTERAIDYHDESVQENFHASRSMKELLKEENNFLENFSKDELKMFRKRHVSLILATDPSKHIEDLSVFKNRLSEKGISEDLDDGHAFIDRTDERSIYDTQE